MRPSGRSETDSLYFSYPLFEQPQERAHLEDRAPVAIVGAGLIGMTAALTLARHGVGSVLFESKATINDGSRAICIARPSIHIFERIGAVDLFLEKARGWITGRSFYRGKQILEFEMPESADEKYRPMYNLQQQFIEQFHWQAIADVQMPHDYPTIRRALFDPDCRPGGTVLVHKQPDDIWRIDYQLADGESDATSEENVRASVAAVLADLDYHGPWELEWLSIYSANRLALDDYRDGPSPRCSLAIRPRGAVRLWTFLPMPRSRRVS